jgi:large conductance mechanosensitive channel
MFGGILGPTAEDEPPPAVGVRSATSPEGGALVAHAAASVATARKNRSRIERPPMGVGAGYPGLEASSRQRALGFVPTRGGYQPPGVGPGGGSVLKEFKAFALRGNVLELAVAVILGIAFGAVVQSFTDNVLMALIAAFFGKPTFDALTFSVGDGVIAYGKFLTAVVNFLIIAFALFLVIKGANRMQGQKTPTSRPCPYCKTQIPLDATRCAACTSQVDAATS